jgi:DNA-binding transcriptional ArsR family regulator
MTTNAMFAEVAALAGDPARAGMLQALMDGRALTAGELARAAGIAPQTASAHLARLAAAAMINVVPQGRHRYHCIASPAVAQMLESIMVVASGTTRPTRPVVTGPSDAALRRARVCYDHLAGGLGVALADALIANGHAELTHEAGSLTETGVALLQEAGINIDALLSKQGQRPARVFCRPCLDWSERRPHLAGLLGAAICAHSLSRNWVRRIDGSRAVVITPKGARVFRDTFGAKLDQT